MVDTSGFPTLGGAITDPAAAQALQNISNPAPAPPPAPGFFGEIGQGLKAGVLGLGADVGGLAGIAGQLTGAQPLNDFSQRVAQGYQQFQQSPEEQAEAQRGFFTNGVGGFIRKVGYSAGAMAPLTAGILATGGLGAAALPADALLGSTLGGAAVAVPSAAGQIYSELQTQPGGASKSNALYALSAGVPVGLLNSLAPETAFGAIGRPAVEGIAARVARGGLEAGAANAAAAGAQTAADVAPRSDMSTVDKAKAIVSGALEGGAIGGVLGGVFGALRPKVNVGVDATNADLDAATKSVVGDGTPSAPPAGLPAPASPGKFPIDVPPPREPAPGAWTDVVKDTRTVAPGESVAGPGFTMQSPGDFAQLANKVPATLVDKPPVPFGSTDVTIRDAESQSPMAKLFEATGASTTQVPKTVSNFLAEDHPADLPSLFLRMQDEFDNKTPVSKTSAFQKVAEKIGLIGSDGKSLNIQDALAEAQKNNAEPATIARLQMLDQIWQAADAIRVKPVEPINAGAPVEPLQIPDATPVRGDGFVADRGTPPVAFRDTGLEQGPAFREPLTPTEKILNAAQDIAGDQTTTIPYAELKAQLKENGDRLSAQDFAEGLRQIDKDETNQHQMVPVEGETKGGIKSPDNTMTHALQFKAEDSNAVPEQGPTGLDVRQSPRLGQPFRSGDTQIGGPAGAGGEVTVREAAPADQGPGAPDLQQGLRVASPEVIPTPADLNLAKQTPQPMETLQTPTDPVAVRAQLMDQYHAASDLPTKTNIAAQIEAHDAANPDLTPKTPFFKRGDDTQSSAPVASPLGNRGISNASIDRHFANTVGRMRPDIQSRIHLIDANDVPPEVMTSMLAEAGGQLGDLKGIRGYYDKGQAYIFRNEVRDRADLEDTISHEVFGHLGVEERLGPNNDQALGALWDRIGGRDNFDKIAKKFGVLDPKPGGMAGVADYLPAPGFRMSLQDKVTAIHELVAHAAERNASTMSQGERSIRAAVASIKQGIASVLREAGLTSFAKKFEGFSANDLAKWVNDSEKALTGKAEGPIKFGDSTGRFSRRAPDVAEQLDTTNRLSQTVASTLQKVQDIPFKGLRREVGRVLLGWKNMDGIVRSASDVLPSLPERVANNKLNEQLQERHAQQHADVYSALQKVLEKDPAKAGRIQDELNRAQIMGWDWRKSWADNKHLHDDPDVKARLGEYVKDFNQSHQFWAQVMTDEQRAAVNDMYALHEGEAYAMNTQTLEKINQQYPELRTFDTPSHLDYLQRNDVHTSPVAYRDFYGDRLNQEYLQKQAKITELMSQAAAGAKNNRDATLAQAAIKQQYAPALQALAQVKNSIDRIQQVPYSHLGRSGDYSVSFHLKPGADGRDVDPAAFEALRAAAAKSFPDVGLDRLNMNSHVFAKFHTEDQMLRFEAMVKQLEKDGHLNPDKRTVVGQLGKDVSYGQMLPDLVNELIDRVKQDDAWDAGPGADPAVQAQLTEARNRVIRDLYGTQADLIAPNSIAGVLRPRAKVQGYSRDAMASMGQHGAAVSRALANDATSQTRAELNGRLRAEMKAAKETTGERSLKASDYGNEVLIRDSSRQPRVANKYVDALTALTHQVQLAASPAYSLLNLSMTPMYAIPQMIKKYPVVRVLQENAAGTRDAFKIMRQVVTQNKLGNISITPEMLKGILNDKDKAAFMDLVNRGGIALSGFSKSQSFIKSTGVNTEYDKLLHMSNAWAIWSETVPRISAALAALRLSGGDVTYADHVVGESMANWGSWNTPRQMGKNGMFGPAGPLVTQFHQFQSHMIDKIGHEFVQSVKDLSGQWRTGQITPTEAQRFVLSHMTAAMVLGGTLGLPAAGWFAGALTRLSSLFNDGESYDVENAFRNFLASTVGTQAGEIIAHGLPHAIGLDTSKMSDADLLPGREFLEDRRKFEDAFPDALEHAAGASVSFGTSLFLGLREVANGRPLEGMQRMMPTSLRNVVGAYRLSDQGYTNAQGEVLPMDANALDVLATGLGLKTSKLTEYQEANRAVEGATDEQKFRKQNLEQNLGRAVQAGDQDGIRKALEGIAEYDSDPAHAQNLESPAIGSYLASRQTKQAVAQSTGRPLSVSPGNLNQVRLTDFLNR